MTMVLRSTDVYDSLSIIVLDGFKPAEDLVELEDGTIIDANETGPIDLPGSANWLVTNYEFQIGEFDPEKYGIIWTDYDLGMDGDGWRFSVLIDGRETDSLIEFAEKAGYTIDRIDDVIEPCVYGDNNGTVTILKHPEGWVISD